MKKLITIIGLGLSLSSIAEVEYGYFASGSDGVDSVALASGDHMTILANTLGAFDITLPSGTSFVLTKADLGLSSYSHYDFASASTESRTITGPCTVALRTGDYAAFKIVRPDAVVEAGPMNIISLPADNNGDVDLLVETSTDLITWTPAYSGSAGTSNNAAFFRTRLIKQ